MTIFTNQNLESKNYFFTFLAICILASACRTSRNTVKVYNPSESSNENIVNTKPNPKAKTFKNLVEIDRYNFVKYAKSMLGVPYKWGSSNPKNGLDCSGLIFNVFQHFNIACPRTSIDYTNEGIEVSKQNAQQGDIILFTGSNHSSGIVGHMGIITKNDSGKIMFVHSASGKNIGVILSSLTGYYENHFVKIIKVLY